MSSELEERMGRFGESLAMFLHFKAQGALAEGLPLLAATYSEWAQIAARLDERAAAQELDQACAAERDPEIQKRLKLVADWANFYLAH